MTREASFRPARAVGAVRLAALALLAPAGVHAQAVPATVVVVDYVNADGIYLPVGSDDGVAAGDTVAARRGPAGAGPSVRLGFTTVTRRRSVARPLDQPWPSVGDTLWLVLTRDLPMAPGARIDARGVDPDEAAGPVPAPPRSGLGPGSLTARGTAFSGSLSLEVHGRESTTAWGGDLPGSATRRYATPTARLSMVGTDLPGGLRLDVSARAAYRYTSDFAGPPPTSVRVYQAALTRSFTSFPVRITAGRFVNPWEQYSGFWDGLLLRVGGTGLGAGIVAGFEPRTADEAPMTELPKLTAFVDLALRRPGWRYDGDVSVHLLRPKSGAEQRSLGWSQRLGLGRVFLSQRLLIHDGAPGTPGGVQQLRLQAGLDLGGGVRLFGAWGHRAPDLAPQDPTLDSLLLAPTLAIRREITLGAGVTRGSGSLGLDVGRSELEGAPPGRTFSARGSLRVGHELLFASGRVRKSDDVDALDLSPGLGLAVAGVDVRTTYRFYRTRSGSGSLETRAIDATLRFAPARGMGLSVGGGAQWGESLGGTFARLTLVRSF